MTDHPVRPMAPGRSELHVQQQTDGRSSLGLFPAEDEPRVVASLLEDLHLEAIGTDLILQEYLHVVPDPRRQERARALVESIRRNYSNAQPSNVDLKSLIEFLYFGGHQRLLRRYHLRFPAYNILDDFFTGAAGPSGPRAPERPVVPGRKWSFLGHEIGFPIGVPASVLTSNAEWVHYFARNGYNVLTYRTVRSRFRNAHPSPNWVLVPSVTQPLPLDESLKDVVADPSDWLEAGVTNVTTSNSFGVPSYGMEEWQSDLREALHVLHEDQVLIVSVLGDVYPEDLESKSPAEALVDDFVATALLAEECTARIIELNLSCPNSVNFVAGEVKPPLCLDAALTERVVSAVRSALKSDTRLIAKLSYLPLDDLRELLTRIGPQVDAIAGINALQSEVHRKDGTETFPGRPLAGVSGIAVRNYALEFVRNLSLIRLEDNHRFEIIGMGGVTDPSSMEAIYRAGANVVQSASGVFANPFLAQDCVSELGLSLPLAPPLPSAGDELTESLRRTLMQKLAADGPMRRSSLAVAVSVPLGQALSAIDDLASEGLIRQQDSQLVSAETSRAS